MKDDQAGARRFGQIARGFLIGLLQNDLSADHSSGIASLPQSLGQYHAANVADLATTRTMVHNALYLTFVLFGALLASMNAVDENVRYYLFLFAPLLFSLLHYLHLYDSWCFVHQEFFVRVTLDKVFADAYGVQSVPGAELLRTPWLIKQFQGTSRQIMHLLPAVGTYFFWLTIVRPNFLIGLSDSPPGHFSLVEIAGTCLNIVAFLLSLWGWFTVGRHIANLRDRYRN